MKDRRTSARRRAIVVLFQSGWRPREIGRLLSVTVRDVEQQLRKALTR